MRLLPPRSAAERRRAARAAWHARDGEACNKLGDKFHDGTSYLAVDRQRALRWFARAAQLGHATAESWRSRLEQEQRETVIYAAATSDEAHAAALYEPGASAHNNASDAVALGDLHCFGEGVPRDAARAAELYERAARQGHGMVALKFGAGLQVGSPPPRDAEQARHSGELDARNAATLLLDALRRDDDELARLLAGSGDQGRARVTDLLKAYVPNRRVE